MSKTHKITQLKKRIAELERKLHCFQHPIINPLHINAHQTPVDTLVVEYHVSFEEYHRFHKQKEYQEHLSQSIARAFVDSELFQDRITSTVIMPTDAYMPVTIRAAIMVAPYQGNLLEDKQ